MKTAYIHCTLLDGSEDMIPQENMTVVEEEGKILEIGGDIVPEPGDKVIDLGGRYLMPGLINLHVHLPGSGAPKKKEQDSKAAAKLVMKNALTKKVGLRMCENYAKTELLSGVTTIRTVGGLGNFDAIIRDRVNAGRSWVPGCWYPTWQCLFLEDIWPAPLPMRLEARKNAARWFAL
ncbi:MAG: amidohydrolase family protein [[Clostridium] scindens]